MNYASEDLKHEHDGILFGLKILDAMVALLRQGKHINKDDYKEIVEFLRLFADKCHHGKEEGLYFPALERGGIPKENGPIGQMLIEHVEGRKYIQEMVAALAGKDIDAKAFTAAAENYASLLRSHINKENTVLFPMGDKAISSAEHQHLLEQFEAFEHNVMGPGIHDKLHGMLDTFEEKYLKNA